MHFRDVRRECVTIHVTDDDSHEEMESFTVRLTARESGVSFAPSDTSEIIILDNDGKLLRSRDMAGGYITISPAAELEIPSPSTNSECGPGLRFIEEGILYEPFP